jgi:hypothetical protein
MALFLLVGRAFRRSRWYGVSCPDHFSRDANCDGVIRNRFGHDRASAYNGSSSNRNPVQDANATADPHIIHNRYSQL